MGGAAAGGADRPQRVRGERGTQPHLPGHLCQVERSMQVSKGDKYSKNKKWFIPKAIQEMQDKLIQPLAVEVFLK